ncbi:hypothetical protein VTP01DRAFT_1953 [Rhizomucor pusillus]|uniref:uncharacterized protein n=1 Tax=Rhizomucor pusillus TaxID=4840 RepID=UPI00374405FE
MTSKTYRRAATSFVFLPILWISIANHAIRRSFILQLVSQLSSHIARLSTTYNFFSRVLASSKRSITGGKGNVLYPAIPFSTSMMVPYGTPFPVLMTLKCLSFGIAGQSCLRSMSTGSDHSEFRTLQNQQHYPVGGIPGPKEPKTTQTNNYLAPLLAELNVLYNGIDMKTYEHLGREVKVRAALMMVACDIPAARKVSSFSSRNTTKACHKYARSFHVFPGTKQLKYSGFDETAWIPRSRCENMRDAKRWLAAKTELEQKDLVRETGTRWSEPHRLEYFDVVRCTVIDPMHNLFLGTAKRMVKLWIELGILTPKALAAMEKSTAGILIPPDMDSLSNGKIAIGFASMQTAE